MVEVISIPTITIKLVAEPITDAYPLRDHHLLLDGDASGYPTLTGVIWEEIWWGRFSHTITQNVAEGKHTLTFVNGGYVKQLNLSWYAWLYVNDQKIAEGLIGRDQPLVANFEVTTTTPPAAAIPAWMYAAGAGVVALVAGVVAWASRRRR
jgi:hypothetical protein